MSGRGRFFTFSRSWRRLQSVPATQKAELARVPRTNRSSARRRCAGRHLRTATQQESFPSHEEARAEHVLRYEPALHLRARPRLDLHRRDAENRHYQSTWD